MTIMLIVITLLVAVYFCTPWGQKRLIDSVFRLRTDNNAWILPLYLLAICTVVLYFIICGFTIFQPQHSSLNSAWSAEGNEDQQRTFNNYKHGKSVTNEELAAETAPEHHNVTFCLWFLLFTLGMFPIAFGYNLFALRDEMGNLIEKVEKKILERKTADENLRDVRVTSPATPPIGAGASQSSGASLSKPLTRSEYFSFEFIIGLASEVINLMLHRGMRSWGRGTE